MGDMADYTIDQIIDSLYEWEGVRDIKCKYCNRYGFTWAETDKGWRLVTKTGQIHTCSAYRKKEPTS